MLTEDALKSLHESCCYIADANWDGRVTVEQDENGCLTVNSFNGDGDWEARLVASPYGEALGGQELWSFEALDGETAIGTLHSKIIMGLLGF